MHNKILDKYYFINKFDQSHLDKQDKKTFIIFRNYDEKIDKKLFSINPEPIFRPNKTLMDA